MLRHGDTCNLMQDEPVSMDLMDFTQFYLPLTDMTKDLGNTPILDYIRGNILEYAEVSNAARTHIAKLKALNIPNDEWRDTMSKPVLEVAIAHNYLALAKWLVEEEGVPLQNDRYVCSDT